MKYAKKFIYIVTAFFLCGCVSSPALQEEPEYTELTMFSDVTFWNFPEWVLESGSITAEISKETNVALNVTIPPQESSKKLSLLRSEERRVGKECRL